MEILADTASGKGSRPPPFQIFRFYSVLSVFPPLQIVRTGPCGDRAEHVSLHWGHNVAAVSHFDEAAVDLRRLLASLILLALRIEQFASPLPQETFTLM